MKLKPVFTASFLVFALFLKTSVHAEVSKEVYSAVEELGNAVSDDGDTVFVNPTKTAGLATLALNLAIKRCKEKEIDTLVLGEGEFVFTSPPKNDAPKTVDSKSTAKNEESEEKEEKEEKFFLFTIFDDDEESAEGKICPEAPLLTSAAVRIDGFDDLTIDATKAKIVCPDNIAAFAITNSSSIKMEIGEIAERKGAKAPVIAFGLCKSISVSINKATANSRTLLFERCANVILRNSEFSTPFEENAKPEGNRNLAAVEFISCKNAVMVRNSLFSNTTVRPLMIRHQAAKMKKASNEVSALFQLSEPDFALAPFASKGDTVAFFTPDGAPFAKRKIIDIKDVERGNSRGVFDEKLFEITFDSPIADILMFCKNPVAVNLSNSAKHTVSNNNFSNNAAEVAVSAYGGVDFVSNNFAAQNVSPVKILSDPKNGVCGLSSKICFIRNNFACYNAPAVLSESRSNPKDEKGGAIEPVLRNLRILKNSFKLENCPVAKLSRSADIILLENKIAISQEGGVILDLEKCQNVSLEGNSIPDVSEVRISNKKCEGEIKVTENSGAKILIKRIFK